MATVGLEVLVLWSTLVTVTLASMAAQQLPDGFYLHDFEPNKYFSYGLVPDKTGQEITLSFYDVDFISSSCDEVSVEVQGDGYFKHDYHRLALLCDPNSVSSYTVTTSKGFHVIVKTGTSAASGSLKAKFNTSGDVRITNTLLYG